MWGNYAVGQETHRAKIRRTGLRAPNGMSHKGHQGHKEQKAFLLRGLCDLCGIVLFVRISKKNSDLGFRGKKLQSI